MNARRIFVVVVSAAVFIICAWIFFTAQTYNSPQAPAGPPTHSSTR